MPTHLCASVLFADARFSIGLGEEVNAADAPVVAFNDADDVAWSRSAFGRLRKIGGRLLAKYVDDDPTFCIPPKARHSVAITETSSCDEGS
ncbi:hypothetical protein [Streptomyces sp. NPDC058457]|uniref:hypothetical protein n=1 Tax=Streptomyces sp. NPDC058457 TaxID=3346507 RepID=UPI003661370C